MKTIDPVLLSLFMRINRKCNNTHASLHRLQIFCFLPERHIPEGQEYENNQHYIDAIVVVIVPFPAKDGSTASAEWVQC